MFFSNMAAFIINRDAVPFAKIFSPQADMLIGIGIVDGIA